MDDLISRKAAIDALTKRRDNWNYYGNEYESAKYEAYDTAIDEITDLPSVQPKNCGLSVTDNDTYEA